MDCDVIVFNVTEPVGEVGDASWAVTGTAVTHEGT